MSSDELKIKKIGQRLRNIRKQKGLSMKDVAKLMDLAESTVQRYETGKITNVTTDVIGLFAKVLNVSPIEILGLDNNQNETYYLNQEAAEYAEYVRTNPDIRILFDASKDISKEDMKKTVDFVNFLKSQERKE